MSKFLVTLATGLALVSVAGCGMIGKGKGKAPAPAPVVYEEPAAEPVYK